MEYSLSTEQIRFFRDTGYLRLPSVLSNDRIATMTRIIQDQFRHLTSPFRVSNSGKISRIEQLFERDSIFLEVLRSPEILQPLQSLLGPNVEVLKFRHNHATLNLTGDIPFRLHRDIQQWSRPVISIFIYLEESTVENGCTHVVPTSHLLPFVGGQSDNGGGNWADEHQFYQFVLNQALPVPMPRGGLLLLDSLTFHTVGFNYTKSSRLSTVFAFHSVDDLDKNSDDSTRILLSGNRIYKGTDNLKISGSLRKPLEENKNAERISPKERT
jgi:ectoine hydroxylase-related dioxygenase (phytanoyl-CoA dioxygenase family)